MNICGGGQGGPAA